jgi:hypothetical protein
MGRASGPGPVSNPRLVAMLGCDVFLVAMAVADPVLGGSVTAGGYPFTLGPAGAVSAVEPGARPFCCRRVLNGTLAFLGTGIHGNQTDQTFTGKYTNPRQHHHTTPTGNHADGSSGGGILDIGGATTLDHSDLTGNHATGGGGGIANSFASLTLEYSTVCDNAALVGADVFTRYGIPVPRLGTASASC